VKERPNSSYADEWVTVARRDLEPVGLGESRAKKRLSEARL